MDYFEQLIKEIDNNINIETDKLLKIMKDMDECKSKIEELKKQKKVVFGLVGNIKPIN
jgi:archaellum component FlaC